MPCGLDRLSERKSDGAQSSEMTSQATVDGMNIGSIFDLATRLTEKIPDCDWTSGTIRLFLLLVQQELPGADWLPHR
jgi:hypothetical protein